MFMYLQNLTESNYSYLTSLYYENLFHIFSKTNTKVKYRLVIDLTCISFDGNRYGSFVWLQMCVSFGVRKP